MKKLLLILWIPLILLLAACGDQADEVARLEEIIVSLEVQRDHLIEVANEQIQEIIELQGLVAELEEQEEQDHAEIAAQDEILDSLMDHMDSTAEALGIDDFHIADIALQGDFVTVRSVYMHNDVVLTFRYWRVGAEIRWILLEYAIGPIVGPGPLDAGRSLWQWEQEIEESFTMRFYNHQDDDDYEYSDKEISAQDWQLQVIDHMRAVNGIQLAGLWYEDGRLVADLTPAGALPFNWGSTGGYLRTRNLIDSLATMPNVTEIEVLVGGQRGVWADHFSFVGVFRVNQ